MLLFQQAFSKAPLSDSFWKCNKIFMLFLTNIRNIIVYWYTMVYSSKIFFLFLLTNFQTFQMKLLLEKTKFTKKQEPEETYNIDLH